jgi:cation transport ATPase
VYIAIDFVSSSKPQFQKLVKTIAINIFISLFYNLLTLYVSFVYYNFISFRFLYSAMLFYEASCTVTVFLSALAGRNFRSVDPLVPVL